MLLLALALPAGAMTYRAGLLQSKINAANDWTTALPLAETERTPGVVMANVNASDSNYTTAGFANPWTGNLICWNKQNTTFGYTGQMWMVGGVAYTFGKCLDDSARIAVDGSEVLLHTKWDEWNWKSYTPSYTGWHEVDIRVADGNGGKGPANKNAWGTAYGLGWNTNNVTGANLTDWTYFMEDGVTNRFRVITDDVMATVDSVTKTATGYDFSVTASAEAPISVALYRTASSDYDNAASWTPATAPVTIAAGASGVISLATEETSYANYQVGVFNADDSVGWFYQFIPSGPLGSLAVAKIGGKTIECSATVAEFGAGASGASVRVEASLAPSFADIATASASAEAALNTPVALTLYGLSYSSAYYLRLRIENSEGLVVYVPLENPVTTSDPAFLKTKVYSAGLFQAQFGTGQEDRTSAIATAAALTIAPGTVMADTTKDATDWAGKTWSWADNRNFGYLGEMYMASGTTYTFGKSVDDWTYVVIDGDVLIDNNKWDGFAFCNYTPAASGWVPVEFRFGNGSGGAGVSQSAAQGFGYNTAGNTVWNDFKAGSSPWAKVVDPGDMSLLRCVVSETPYMTVASVAPDGADMEVAVSFAGVPAEGGVLQALWGAGDGEYVAANWAHVDDIATIAAGDTAEATYTVSGAGTAAYIAFRFVSAAGVTPAWTQWSEIYNLSASSPAFGLFAAEVVYTNVTYTASCSGLGAGASSVEANLEIASDVEFQNVLRTVPLALTGIGGETLALNGFVTNTTYYARIAGENNLGESGYSAIVTLTTLDPQPPEGICAFAGRGFSTLSANAVVTAFGTGSASAVIRLEASTAADFATLAGVSDEVAATVGTGTTLVVPSLAPDTSYNLRLRIVNEWGLATYVPIAQSYATREAPLTASGIGYTFSADGSAVDISFGVTEVFDGARCTATLEYDGKPVSSAQTFTGAGTLSWAGIPSAGKAATATVTVTALVDGATYTQTWTATVTPGSVSHALSSLAELSNVAFRVGDTATLPELVGATDYYVALDMRSFKLGADGLTLTALEPGFSAVVAMEYDAAIGGFGRNPTAGLAVCIPEVEGSGRVFLAKTQTGRWSWNDATKWTNLTDPTAEADYPHLVDDVAIVPMPKNQVVIESDITVGEIYIGQDATSLNNGEIRLTGRNSATLTFRRSSGKPGLLRVTGLARYDVVGGYYSFNVGGGDGNTSTGLGIEMPGGLVFDGGDWPDWTDTATRAVSGRMRYFPGQGLRYWNIPAGQTLRIVNMYGYNKLVGDTQGGNANFGWDRNGQVTGSGTFLYDAVSSTYIINPFRAFEGTVAVRNKQKYDGFSWDQRGGSFWVAADSDSDVEQANATLLIEGDSAYTGLPASFGVVSYGNAHGYGANNRRMNALPGKAWILNGGTFHSGGQNVDQAFWREDGTTATSTVCIPNGAETLVVSNGFSRLSLGSQGDANRPTNAVTFAELEHAGDGTLWVHTDRMWTSTGQSLARAYVRLEGFADHAVGGTGVASYSISDASAANVLPADAPIVPWIVAPISNSDNVFFPGAAADGTLVLAGWPANSVLNDVSDPTLNVSVDGKSILLDHDVTVNSLRITKNRDQGRQLGEGRTLTITSGGLILGGGNIVYFDEEKDVAAGTQGTLNFPTKAWVYSTLQNTSEPNQIWSRMVAPQGAVFSFPGVLRLGGDQTGIDDHIAVNGTRLELGSATAGCTIDVPVHAYGANAKLVVNKAGSFCRQPLHFWGHGTPGAQFVAQAGTEEVVEKFYVDGVSMPRGYYGSSEAEASISALATSSHPAFVDDRHFSGTGWVKVLKDDVVKPTMLLIK